jgi:hypothetical protein
VAETLTLAMLAWWWLLVAALVVTLCAFWYLAGWVACYRNGEPLRRATALVSQSQTECLFDIATRLGLTDYALTSEQRARLAAIRERIKEPVK